MSIIAWIIVGLIAGALGKLIMPGDDPGGIIVTILIGIVGAFVGGFLTSLLGFGGVTGFNLWSILVATVGAIILLAIYRAVVGAGLPDFPFWCEEAFEAPPFSTSSASPDAYASCSLGLQGIHRGRNVSQGG